MCCLLDPFHFERYTCTNENFHLKCKNIRYKHLQWTWSYLLPAANRSTHARLGVRSDTVMCTSVMVAIVQLWHSMVGNTNIRGFKRNMWPEMFFFLTTTILNKIIRCLMRGTENSCSLQMNFNSLLAYFLRREITFIYIISMFMRLIYCFTMSFKMLFQWKYRSPLMRSLNLLHLQNWL